MAYDLLIKNGLVVDGTGAAAVRANVAVADGRIAAIGSTDESAKKVIDADGLVVSPGFFDPHTHYDAQISWDNVLGGSAEHGVTSVVMGNCGVGVAPCRPELRGLLIDDLVTVEGIDKEVLATGIQWGWESFPEYIAAAERGGCALNRGFLVPLAPLRTYVLGEAAADRAATGAETQAMAGLLRAAMDAGALGFSSTAMLTHIGHHGKPLSARLASRDELAAFCGVLKTLGRGVIELALTKKYANLGEDEQNLLEFVMDASGRPVTWLSLHNLVEKPNAIAQILDRIEPLIRRGCRPQILTRPMLYEMNLRRPFQFGEISAAKPIFDAPFERQMALYADPAFRQAFKDELKLGRKWTTLAKNVGIAHVHNPALKKHEGRTVGEIAAETGQDPNDVLFDIAVADRLDVKFVVPRANTDIPRLKEVLGDSRTMIGLSDAGAHLDMLCEAGYTTYLLGHWVREERALTLEHAIKRITSEPADFFGFKDRGRLAAGAAADICVFDADRIGSPARATMVYDLPAGGGRLRCAAEGIARVIVNGVEVYEDGRQTGALPGQVLRLP
jgi:N-acyl-D-amino-acid deacylase